MSKSLFVVVANNFEYTDEYYYPSGGSTPVKAYSDRAKAQKAADRLTNRAIKTMDTHSLAEYIQGWNQELSWSECNEMVSGSLKSRMAEVKLAGVEFYHVVEVKLAGSKVKKGPGYPRGIGSVISYPRKEKNALTPHEEVDAEVA